MGVAVFKTGFLSSTDEARYVALKNQRDTVGLNDTERDEFAQLEAKLREVK